MATPSALVFHENSRQFFRKMLDEKIKNTAQLYYKNTINPSFSGYPKTSTGSWNTPFGTTNDFGKPFAPIPGSFAQGKPFYDVGILRNEKKGGIRSNKSYPKIKGFLKQRSRDFETQNNPLEPPIPAPMEVLTDDDILKIELNSDLNTLMDFADGSSIKTVGTPKDLQALMRRVIVLIAQLAPRLSGPELQDQVGYWNDMNELAEAELTEKGDASAQWNNGSFVFLDYVSNLQTFVTRMLANQTLSESEKVLLARDLLRDMSITVVTANKMRAKAIKDGRDMITKEYEPFMESSSASAPASSAPSSASAPAPDSDTESVEFLRRREELRQMTVEELRKTMRDYNLPYRVRDTKKELIDRILAEEDYQGASEA